MGASRDEAMKKIILVVLFLLAPAVGFLTPKEEAKKISFSIPFFTSFSTSKEEQWFAIEIHKTSDIAFELLDSPRSFDVKVELQNEKNEVIKSLVTYAYRYRLNSGKYWMKLFSYVPSYKTFKTEGVHFWVTSKEHLDPWEPNNTEEEAKTISPNKTYEVQLLDGEDKEYFKIKIGKPGYVRLFPFHKYAHFEYQLIPLLKKEMAQKRALFEWTYVEAGEYYFVLSPVGYISDFSLERWTLYYHESAQKDEANADKEHATLLELNRVQKFFLFHPADHDWFKIEIPADGHYVILFQSLPQDTLKKDMHLSFTSEAGEKYAPIVHPMTSGFLKKGTYVMDFSRKSESQGFLSHEFQFLISPFEREKIPFYFYLINMDPTQGSEKLKWVARSGLGEYIEAQSVPQLKKAFGRATGISPRSRLWIF